MSLALRLRLHLQLSALLDPGPGRPCFFFFYFWSSPLCRSRAQPSHRIASRRLSLRTLYPQYNTPHPSPSLSSLLPFLSSPRLFVRRFSLVSEARKLIPLSWDRRRTTSLPFLFFTFSFVFPPPSLSLLSRASPARPSSPRLSRPVPSLHSRLSPRLVSSDASTAVASVGGCFCAQSFVGQRGLEFKGRALVDGNAEAYEPREAPSQ